MFALWQEKATARVWASQQCNVQGKQPVLPAISVPSPMANVK